jgi:hypothetical protein
LIENQFNRIIPDSIPATTLCDFMERVAICKQVNGSPGCYDWELNDCFTCCWEGHCAPTAQECP